MPPTDAPMPPTDAPMPPTDAPMPPTDAPMPPTDAPMPPTDAPTTTVLPSVACKDLPGWNAGYGVCSTYAQDTTGAMFSNYEWCSSDVDTYTPGNFANEVCPECGSCVGLQITPPSAAPTNPPTVAPTAPTSPPTACKDLPGWDAGYGNCSTYATGESNYGWCSMDMGPDGNFANQVCFECGTCTGGNATTAPTTAPTTPPTAVPTVAPANQSATCKDIPGWNAGYGECDQYQDWQPNSDFCAMDMDAEGNLAENVCSECGVCKGPSNPSTAAPTTGNGTTGNGTAGNGTTGNGTVPEFKNKSFGSSI